MRYLAVFGWNKFCFNFFFKTLVVCLNNGFLNRNNRNNYRCISVYQVALAKRWQVDFPGASCRTATFLLPTMEASRYLFCN